MNSLLICLVAFAALTAQARPTMVTHGYRACASCHVSPSGGGALSEYGREMAGELVSFHQRHQAVSPTHGAISIPEWLVLGGDLRVLQSVLRAEGYTRKNFTLMQADLELGFIANDVTVSGTIGYQNPSSQEFYGTEIFSRRHYANWRITDNHSLQVGKLPPAYGINWPDHWLLVRRGLRLGENTETYQAQYRYLDEIAEATAYYSVGRPDAKELAVETATGARVAVDMSANSYVAFNTLVGWHERKTRYLMGIGFALGFAKGLTLFADLDWQMSDPFVGVYRTLRLDYEPIQGIHFFVIHESARSEPGINQETLAHTLGVQFFPIGHIELSAAVQFSQVYYAWGLLHYYL